RLHSWKPPRLRRGRASYSDSREIPCQPVEHRQLGLLNVGFCRKRCNAEADVGSRPPIRLLFLRFPGLERADFPVALPLLASFSLKPGLRAAHDEACQKVSACQTIRSIGGCDRGHGATRAGARVLPRHAGVLLAATEYRAGSGFGVSEVGVRRKLDDFL